MNTIKEIAIYWRERMRNHEDLSDTQVAIDFFSQTAANCMMSFDTWRVDHELPVELEEVGRAGFAEFSSGMIGVR